MRRQAQGLPLREGRGDWRVRAVGEARAGTRPALAGGLRGLGSRRGRRGEGRCKVCPYGDSM